MKFFRLNKNTYNLFYLFVCIIWTPLQLYYLHVDGAARTIMLLSIIALLLNYSSFHNHRNLFHSTQFVCWTILVVFSFINSMAKGFEAENGFLIYIWGEFLSPYIFLLIAILEINHDTNRCLKIILIAQLLYLIIGGTHFSGGAFDRFSAVGIGNLLPLMGASCVFIAGLLFCNRQLKGGWITYGLILVVVLYIIIMAATRKALGAVVLAVAGMVLGRSKKVNIQSMILVALFALIVYWGMGFLIENTLIGQRIVSSSEEYDVPLSSNPTINSFLMTLLGDRSIMYYMGSQIFHQHPITGIGLNNFSKISQIGIRLHTEYMVQICENGLVGFSLLIIYYLTLFRGLNKKRKKGNNIFVYLFGLLMILFLNLTAWTYNMNYIMIIYSVLIFYINSTTIKYENSYSPPQRQLQ